MKNLQPYIIIVLCILLFISIKSCQNNRQDFKQLQEFSGLQKDTIRTYRAKNGDTIKYVQQIRLYKQNLSSAIEENKSLKSTLDNMKVKTSSVSTITQIVNHQKTDTLYITYTNDTCFTHLKDTIKFKDSASNYNIKGMLFKNKLALTKIDFSDTLTMVTQNVGNIFTDKYRIDIAHSNKLITTTSITSLTLKPQKHWWQTTLFKMGVGFIGGIYVEAKIK